MPGILAGKGGTLRVGRFDLPPGLLRAGLAGLVLVGLGACTLEPIKTQPPAAAAQGASPALKTGAEPRVLSYCYGNQVNEPSQVLDYAREDCPGGRLVFSGEDILWTKCPLVQPVRATFLCYPAESEQPAANQSLLR